MPTLVWDDAADVDSVTTKDGNDPGDLSSPLASTALWSDVFGSVIDALYTQIDNTNKITFNETGGKFEFGISSVIDSGVQDQYVFERRTNIQTGDNDFDFEWDLSNITYAENVVGSQNMEVYMTLPNYNFGDAVDDELRWLLHLRGANPGYLLRAYFIEAGSNMNLANFSLSNPVETDIDCRLCFDSSTDTFDWLHQENGGGYSSLVTNVSGTFDAENVHPKTIVQATGASAAERITGFTCDIEEVIQRAGSSYWENVIVLLANKTFKKSNILLSTSASTEEGVVEYQYSTDGGSTFNGSWLTISQLQSEPDISSVTQLQFMVRFNGGGEVDLASLTDLQVESELSGLSNSGLLLMGCGT